MGMLLVNGEELCLDLVNIERSGGGASSVIFDVGRRAGVGDTATDQGERSLWEFSFNGGNTIQKRE